MNDTSNARRGVHPIGKKNPNLPFHPAVRAGDFIFVSGQVAKDAEGNMISGTIEEETRWHDRIHSPHSGRRRRDARRRRAGHHLSRGRARLRPLQQRVRRAFQGCGARPHHRRSARGDQHQDRDGRHCVQAAWTLKGRSTLCGSDIHRDAEGGCRDQIAGPTDVRQRSKGDLLPGGAGHRLHARGLRPAVRQYADRRVPQAQSQRARCRR